MNPATRERLFGFRHAFDSPVTLWMTIAVIAAILIAAIIIWLLRAAGRTSDKLHDELVKRVVSWAVMTPLLLGPVLLGAAWTILAVAILSILCYREFARATGFFRYRSLSIVVVLGIIATTFAIADHWYGFFVAIPPLTMVLLAMVAILRDEPRGYTQRVGVGVIGFLLFGCRYPCEIDRARFDRERGRTIRRSDGLINQARHRDQGYGSIDSGPWRIARSFR